MDLQQRKLTKSEWDSIEKPIPEKEVEILNLITSGYSDVNVRYNNNHTLLSFLKIEGSDLLEDYLFQKYYSDTFVKLIKQNPIIDEKLPEVKVKIASLIKSKSKSKTTLKKALLIRTQRYTQESVLSEPLLENTIVCLLESFFEKKMGKKKTLDWNYEYYTLFKLMRVNLVPNKHILDIVNIVLDKFESEISVDYIIQHSALYVEQNAILLKYTDMSLFEHQKRVFTASKNDHPKLILYTAPTGTGKTLTPLGLLEKNKVIFVCAARHVGLALAKAAINVQKKVAFAFGCDTADDIRLHYFAAKDYTKNTKTGGIWKVDNAVGDKVELIICDVKSYLPAMYYMLAFNSKDSMITYWDEPTITLDYEYHDCHEIIQRNWKENLIPNVILSSATLPKMSELTNTVADFQTKFPDPETQIFNITSYECRKSVPLVNKQGYIISPHNLNQDHEKMMEIIKHCESNPTLMRYFDLKDISSCIHIAHENNYTHRPLERYFATLDDINLTEIKKYYLKMLKNISSGVWGALYMTTLASRSKAVEESPPNSQGSGFRKVKSIDSTVFTSGAAGAELSRTKSESQVNNANTNYSFGTFISTQDAHTLTSGPTIYLSDEPEKIAKFCIQQANIPEAVLTNLLQSIEFNNTITHKIEKIERDIDDALPKETSSGDKEGGKSGKSSNSKKTDRALNEESSSSLSQLKEKLESYKKLIKTTQLNDTFVPNKNAHLEKWANGKNTKDAFTSSITEEIIVQIMLLNDVSNTWKILLMMGIGVFTSHKSVAYTEIMKQLADQQQLYIIIASSDYVYGTNYQFCHGYISKNMVLTQEKIIQAIGRVGRNGLQQKYTVRFRDDEPITKLFTTEENKPEVLNMNRLFSSGET